MGPLGKPPPHGPVRGSGGDAAPGLPRSHGRERDVGEGPEASRDVRAAQRPGGEVRRDVWLLNLGRVEYGAAYELQRRLQAERDADRVPDLLVLVEHLPVITLGRRGSREHIFLTDDELAARGVGLFETNRGGLVTYHGPGQIVGYPIARLRELAGDAPTYVWRLEETIIRTLSNFGILARRDAGNRGVFAEGGKIAAIGVAVTHGVTMHGFALNVCPDLDHFAMIDPCGIGDLGVTSVERLLGTAPDLNAVCDSLIARFEAVFGRSVRPAPPVLWELIGSWGLLEAPGHRVEIRPIHS